MKEFLVTELACRHTPQEVAEMLFEQFRLRVDRRQVQAYDPERAGRKPATRWCTLFHAKRAEFDAGEILPPIAARAFRMRELHRISRAAIRGKNLKLAAEMIEQAAKEESGVYSNNTRKGLGPGASIDDIDPKLVQQIVEEKAVWIRAVIAEMDRSVMGYAPTLGETAAPADWPHCPVSAGRSGRENSAGNSANAPRALADAH